MEIIFLGSGTGFPNVRRASPGILVKLPQTNLLMDSGPGTVRQLARVGLSVNDIDTILYTHLHPDHTVDLIDFLFCAKYQVTVQQNLPAAVKKFIASGGKGFRTKPLHLIGPTGFKRFYQRIVALYGTWVASPTYRLKITEIHPVRGKNTIAKRSNGKGEYFITSTTEASNGVKERGLKFPGWQLRSAEMRHEKTSVGYRIEAQGKSVVYSGDTGYCPNIVRLGQGADLLILECSTSDEINLPRHLTPRTVARIARESGAKKVILTHIYEVGDKFNLLQQVRRNWPEMPAGRVRLAQDLMRVKLTTR